MARVSKAEPKWSPLMRAEVERLADMVSGSQDRTLRVDTLRAWIVEFDWLAASLAEAREREENATIARQAAQAEAVDLHGRLVEADEESAQFVHLYEAAQAECAEAREEIKASHEGYARLAAKMIMDVGGQFERAEAAEARLREVQGERDAVYEFLSRWAKSHTGSHDDRDEYWRGHARAVHDVTLGVLVAKTRVVPDDREGR